MVREIERENIKKTIKMIKKSLTSCSRCNQTIFDYPLTVLWKTNQTGLPFYHFI